MRIKVGNGLTAPVLRIKYSKFYILALLLLSITIILQGKDIYISPQGKGDGTKGNPTTIYKAVEELKTLTPSMTEDIYIIFEEGRYQLSRPIKLTEEESGKNSHFVIFKSANYLEAKISGGIILNDWEKTKIQGIYKTSVPESCEPRMAYSEEKELVRARFPNTHIPGVFYFKLPGYFLHQEGTEFDEGNYPVDTENKRWDIGRQGQFIEPFDYHGKYNGFGEEQEEAYRKAMKEGQVAMKEFDFVKWHKKLENPDDVEIVMMNAWRTRMFKFSKIERDGKYQWLYPTEDHWANQAEHVRTSNNPIHFENDLTFIDLDGEWSFDSKEHTLYLKSVNEPGAVAVSRLENLVTIKNANNIKFDGLVFENGSFRYPNYHGFFGRFGGLLTINSGYLSDSVPHLRGSVINQSDRSRAYHWSPGVFEVDKSRNICFENNMIHQTEGNGVVLIGGNENIKLSGNVFMDIGDSGLLVDAAQDLRGTYAGPTRNVEVKNNLFTRMGDQFPGGMAIFSAFPVKLEIENNTFCEMEGFCVNIGWMLNRDLENVLHDNTFKKNLVFDVASWCNDCSVLHTKSAPASKPHTVISENFVHSIDNRYFTSFYTLNPMYGHSQIWYLDDGTNYVNLKNNVVRDYQGVMLEMSSMWSTERYRTVQSQSRRGSPPYISFNQFDGNFASNEKIEMAAGLEPGYRHLLFYISDKYKDMYDVSKDGSIHSFYPASISESTSELSDIEGNSYRTMTIGSQIWMAENLRTTKYNDGSSIEPVSDPAEWTELQSPAYCWYDNDVENYGKSYGILYNSYAIETGKVCPVGWHLPTNSEWITLSNYFGDEWATGKMLDQIGFNNSLAGFRSSNGSFNGINEYQYWWSAPQKGDPIWGPVLYDVDGANYEYVELIWDRGMYDGYFGKVFRWDFNKNKGYSVRCIRDLREK